MTRRRNPHRAETPAARRERLALIVILAFAGVLAVLLLAAVLAPAAGPALR